MTVRCNCLLGARIGIANKTVLDHPEPGVGTLRKNHLIPRVHEQFARIGNADGNGHLFSRLNGHSQNDDIAGLAVPLPRDDDTCDFNLGVTTEEKTATQLSRV
jgi:hypothetical protein